MARTITVTHEYPYSARDVWAVATDFDSLAKVMRKVIVFDRLPRGRIEPGQEVAVRVSLFGMMPWQDYLMRVVEMSDAEMWFQSDEHGAGVKSWRHRCSVVETAEGCRLTDEVEIDAGLMTPLIAWWAGVVYRARHRPRLELLARGHGHS